LRCRGGCGDHTRGGVVVDKRDLLSSLHILLEVGLEGSSVLVEGELTLERVWSSRVLILFKGKGRSVKSEAF
jgi:hypothetical protein